MEQTSFGWGGTYGWAWNLRFAADTRVNDYERGAQVPFTVRVTTTIGVFEKPFAVTLTDEGMTVEGHVDVDNVHAWQVTAVPDESSETLTYA